MRCKVWEVWRARIQLADATEPIDTPVVIVRVLEDHAVALRTATSLVRQQKGYQLKDQAVASLPLHCVVLMKALKLTDTDLIHKMGYIGSKDLIEIQTLIQSLIRSTQ
jgi:hypothetical protein